MSDTRTGYVLSAGPQAGPALETLRALADRGWLPAGETWWFAWHELDIQLPGLLRDWGELPLNWDVLHVFSPRCEFRQVRRGPGWQQALLTEAEAQLPAGWALAGAFQATNSLRILWGSRLLLFGQTARGEVKFPRRLDYDLGWERPQDAVVADVRCYSDEQARLQFVRYARVRHLRPGDSTAIVQPFAGVDTLVSTGGAA